MKYYRVEYICRFRINVTENKADKSRIEELVKISVKKTERYSGNNDNKSVAVMTELVKKELSEYFLVVTGTTATAEDGEMVFVVRLKDSEGEFINHTVAMNDNGNYVFDYEINKYKKLS